jgi:UrcA family protein
MSVRIARWALASMAAAVCWSAAPRVLAQPPGEVDEVVINGASTNGETIRHQWVYYADLDLRREPGARALLNRIRAAARNVCEPDPSIHDLREQTSYRVCLYEAISGALRRVDNPHVADLYEGES